MPMNVMILFSFTKRKKEQNKFATMMTKDIKPVSKIFLDKQQNNLS